MMSFRNIKTAVPSGKRTFEPTQTQSILNFDVLKTRMKRAGDIGMWQDIYRKQINKDFVVDDWILWLCIGLVGIGVGLGAGIGGFFLGKKLCATKSVKQALGMFIPDDLKKVLPRKIKSLVL